MLVIDCAYPLTNYPTSWKGTTILGGSFYIGGNTPHVWTLDEVAELKKHYRFLLPIFTRSDPQNANASADFNKALEQLRYYGVPSGRGYLMQLDYEAAVDSSYELAFDAMLLKNGYRLELYGQSSTVTANKIPSGGYDIARWTNQDYAPTSTADQFADVGEYDLNDFRNDAPLWDTQYVAPKPPVPPVAPPIPQEDPMSLKDATIVRLSDSKDVYLLDLPSRMLWHITTIASLEGYIALGCVQHTMDSAELGNIQKAITAADAA